MVITYDRAVAATMPRQIQMLDGRIVGDAAGAGAGRAPGQARGVPASARPGDGRHPIGAHRRGGRSAQDWCSEEKLAAGGPPAGRVPQAYSATAEDFRAGPASSRACRCHRSSHVQGRDAVPSGSRPNAKSSARPHLTSGAWNPVLAARSASAGSAWLAPLPSIASSRRVT